VCKFCQWKILRPVILMMVNIGAQEPFNPFVFCFHLSVCTRVVRCRDILCDPQNPTDFMREFRRKAGVSVTDDLSGKSIGLENVLYELACHTFCADRLITRDEECHFGAIVVGDGKDRVVTIRLR
jgi:hypothetical protein